MTAAYLVVFLFCVLLAIQSLRENLREVEVWEEGDWISVLLWGVLACALGAGIAGWVF